MKLQYTKTITPGLKELPLESRLSVWAETAVNRKTSSTFPFLRIDNGDLEHMRIWLCVSSDILAIYWSNWTGETSNRS